MDFQELERRFIEHLRQRIRSGELTERKLARMAGISQPHVHNVLNGKRVFSLSMADTILQVLKLDVLDLIKPEEAAEIHRRRANRMW
jgi:transcriptional regulator with XRE-family HTH domain